MKKKLLFCLTFIMLVCVFCLPLAFKAEKAYAADNYDISGYKIKDSMDQVAGKQPLYSNGIGEGTPRSKTLSVEDITGVPGTTQIFKGEFGGKPYMIPVASSKENEHVKVSLDAFGSLKIEAVKASDSPIVIYAAIADNLESESVIYIINVEVICNLPDGIQVEFYSSSTASNNEYKISVGEQDVIDINAIVRYAADLSKPILSRDFKDGTDITIQSVTALQGSESGVEVKSFGKMFTLYAIAENPVPTTPYYIEVVLQDKAIMPKGTARFEMRVFVIAAERQSVIQTDATTININERDAETRLASQLATSLAGKTLFFDTNPNRHALRDDSNTGKEEITDEFGSKILLLRNNICEVKIIAELDERNNKLEITPLRNGFITIVVYVSTVATGTSPSVQSKVFLSINVTGIYNLEPISIDSLRKVTLSVHDTYVFGSLSQDGYSLVGITDAPVTSLVAKVESGSLIINPKAEGEQVIELHFANGANQIRVPLTITVHKFDLFKDLSMLEIAGVIAGIILLLFLIILFIILRYKRRRKMAVEKAESKVVIGRRDIYTGTVINPALNKVREQQGIRVPYQGAPNAYVNPYFMLNPNQPQQGPMIALNASQPVVMQQQRSQPQPQQPVFMALTQGKGETQSAVPEFHQPIPSEPQQAPQVMNIYVTDAPMPETPAPEAPAEQQVFYHSNAQNAQNEQQPVNVYVENPAPQVIVQEPAAAETVILQAPKAEHGENVFYQDYNPTDDEILEKAFKERYQNTMKYRQFRKDKELQTKILLEEREKIRIENETRRGQAASGQTHAAESAAYAKASAAAHAETAGKVDSDTIVVEDKTAAQEHFKPASEVFVTDAWIQEADLSKLIDKQMDLDEELLKTMSALREISDEKEKLNMAVGETMKKYKDLGKEIEDLKIKLSNTPDADEAAPIYEKLNAAEGEYSEMTEGMANIAEKMKQRRGEIEKAEAEYTVRKASIELAKMDVEDRIKELKEKQAAEGIVTISVETARDIIEEEVPAVITEEVKLEKAKEADEIAESLLRLLDERNNTEIEREKLKLEKEIAEREIKELQAKFEKSDTPAEKEIIGAELIKKSDVVAGYEKDIEGYDAQLTEQSAKIFGQEVKMNTLAEKYGFEDKLKESVAERARRDEDLKVKKERVKEEIISAEEKQQKAEEMDALTEFMLKIITDRNRTELKSENVKFRKELAEKDLSELENELVKAETENERAELMAEISEKRDDISEYNKKLREYEDYMSEYSEKMAEYEAKLHGITSKYDMGQKLQEFNMALVQQDFDHKVEKERIRSEKLIETERLEAEKKVAKERRETEKKLARERRNDEARVAAAVDESAKAGMLEAEKKFNEERAANERKLRELEERAKQGALSERLAFKRQQIAFVSEDVPRMRDPEHGFEMLQKIEKIEKDLAQDERISDIIFEIGRVKDSINHGIELAKLRAQLNRKNENVVYQPAPQTSAPAPAPAPATRTVVKKVTNNVRKVSSQNRQPQVIRVAGPRPGTSARAAGQRTMQGSARSGQRPMARPGQRPVQGSARLGQRPMARPGQRPARPGQRPARPGMTRSATRQGGRRP